MGFLNSLLKGLGFEDEKKQQTLNDYEDDIILDNRNISENKNVSLNNLVVYSPKNNKEVKTLVDYLKKGQACIVNLENLSKDESSRILDFLSGAIYALNGKINRLQNMIFVLLPSGVNLTKM